MGHIPFGISSAPTKSNALLCVILCFGFSRALASETSQPVPLGLPSIDAQRVPAAASTNVAELGHRLFFAKQLSADGTISCSSCHDSSRAFTDGRVLAIGIKGRRGTRNAPSLFNVTYSSSLFWDGRVTSLESQAHAPLINHSEHGLADDQQAARIVQNDQALHSAYSKIFGEPVTTDNLAAALASYERTLLAGDSPFDRYYYAGNKAAMTQDAIRGLELFTGRARCATCHLVQDHYALFTDQQFHPSTTNLPDDVNAMLPELTQRVQRAKGKSNLKLDQLIADDPNIAALGRFTATLDPADIGRFKTPSLRNVAVTGPYMHDGSVRTLEQAVELELYVRGESNNYPIVLTTDERKDLLSFLRALNSSAQQ